MNGKKKYNLNFISQDSVIAIDTMVFIYKFSGDNQYFDLVTEIFQSLIARSTPFISSIVTYMEVLSHPLLKHNDNLINKYRVAFKALDNFQFIHTSQDIADEASFLRRQYGLRLPDALQVATAKVNNCSTLITNDKFLKRSDKYMKITLLEDYL
ncbi:PIN domain-containing protein [Patescibacteria group bacterium]|nr:PIN domain-containing protein [Patescibacteria group bacterium]